MGQPIVVTEKPSSANRGVVRFETNRALTGMSHERYLVGDTIMGERPPDELARRLIAHGGVGGVHINSNVITVHLDQGGSTDGLREIIENLYIFYPATEAVDPREAQADLAEADHAPEQQSPPRPETPDEEIERAERTAPPA